MTVHRANLVTSPVCWPSMFRDAQTGFARSVVARAPARSRRISAYVAKAAGTTLFTRRSDTARRRCHSCKHRRRICPRDDTAVHRVPTNRVGLRDGTAHAPRTGRRYGIDPSRTRKGRCETVRSGDRADYWLAANAGIARLMYPSPFPLPPSFSSFAGRWLSSSIPLSVTTVSSSIRTPNLPVW